jgi:hypothetical protein
MKRSIRLSFRNQRILRGICIPKLSCFWLVGAGAVLFFLSWKADGFTDPYLSHARSVKTFPATVGVPNAVGDGVTDDTAAFQACLQYGRSGPQYQTVGTAVYVPPGTYLISQPLVVWAPLERNRCGRYLSSSERGRRYRKVAGWRVQRSTSELLGLPT